MKHQYPGAYAVASKNKWIDDYYWFVPRFKWTYEKVLCAAKQCKTLNIFKHKESAAYSAATKNGWLDEIKEIMGW
jgi:hypothetical protein